MSEKTIDIAFKTDRGLQRPNNEDEAGSLTKTGMEVLLVADGMGGHQSGEVASRIAKETVLGVMQIEQIPSSIFRAKRLIKKAMKKANTMIHKLSSRKDEYYGMGTTIVMALVLDDITYIVNCGDSRAYAYRLRDRNLVALTTDQTVVQYLFKLGAISKEEMKTSPKRHVLMNAVGISPSIQYDLSIIHNDYDMLLLCSDGLTNMVDETEIEKIMNENKDQPAKVLADALVAAANKAGGVDNIAVSILEVKGK
jgi:serine/threonine protein phosphatase PrpC